MKNYDLHVNVYKGQEKEACKGESISLLMDVEKAKKDSRLRLEQYALRIKKV